MYSVQDAGRGTTSACLCQAPPGMHEWPSTNAIDDTASQNRTTKLWGIVSQNPSSCFSNSYEQNRARSRLVFVSLTLWRRWSLRSLPQDMSTMPSLHSTTCDLWKGYLMRVTWVTCELHRRAAHGAPQHWSVRWHLTWRGYWNYLHEVWSRTEWDHRNYTETWNSQNLSWNHGRLGRDERYRRIISLNFTQRRKRPQDIGISTRLNCWVEGGPAKMKAAGTFYILKIKRNESKKGKHFIKWKFYSIHLIVQTSKHNENILATNNSKQATVQKTRYYEQYSRHRKMEMDWPCLKKKNDSISTTVLRWTPVGKKKTWTTKKRGGGQWKTGTTIFELGSCFIADCTQ